MTLYTRPLCPLCDELLERLAGLPLEIEKVDVDSDRALKKRYGLRIPVLVDAAGEVLVEGRPDGGDLRRLGSWLQEARA